MRVLLDENLPRGMAALLEGHEVYTVSEAGWAGAKNGQLLRLASGSYGAFLTMDRRLPDQQRVEDLPFAVVVIAARSNRIADLRPVVPRILEALDFVEPGTVTVVSR